MGKELEKVISRDGWRWEEDIEGGKVMGRDGMGTSGDWKRMG